MTSKTDSVFGFLNNPYPRLEQRGGTRFLRLDATVTYLLPNRECNELAYRMLIRKISEEVFRALILAELKLQDEYTFSDLDILLQVSRTT